MCVYVKSVCVCEMCVCEMCVCVCEMCVCVKRVRNQTETSSSEETLFYDGVSRDSALLQLGRLLCCHVPGEDLANLVA